MKRAVYSHPAGLGVHLLQINLLLQSYSHQSAVRLSVTKWRDEYEFSFRRGWALVNPTSRPALGYPQQPVQTASELRPVGVKRSGRVATHSLLHTPYVKKNRSFTSTPLYVISRVVLTETTLHGVVIYCWWTSLKTGPNHTETLYQLAAELYKMRQRKVDSLRPK